MVITAIAVPSFAHHKDSHGGGGPQATPTATPAPSEDTDGSETSKNDGPTSGCDQAGANDGGEYDSNCDGRASENGSEDRTSGGTPCAGCVGAADNKNPGEGSGKGQQVDATDSNNGYECDGNNGLSKGNPAHTACPEDAPPPPPPPTPTPPVPPTPTPTPTCVIPEGDVSCDDDHVKPGPVVCQNLKHCTPPPPPITCKTNCDFVDPECIDRVGAVCSDDSSTRSETVLPLTGGAILPFLIAGLLGILGGAFLVRRTKADDPSVE